AMHESVIVALSADQTGAAAAFNGSDGAALARAFEDIATNAGDADFPVRAADYAELFRTAISDRVVRRPGLPGVRLRIYGLLEARLQSVDRIVLGGLIEGTWPPEMPCDPWLSRPMRQALGLDLPERRIALSAHDFAQMLGAREVILTRAAKSAGAPTVAARFLQRLAAVTGARWADVCARGDKYLAWARKLDAPQGEPVPAKPPEPKPAVAARPTRLSVTEIEHW